MATIDINELAAAIVAALKGEISSGFNTVSAFARKQAKRLAVQAALIAEGRITGQIDAEMLKFFDAQLKAMTDNFARSLAALTIITLEKAWNAVVGVVWNGVNGALQGAGLGPLQVPRAPRV